MTLKTKGQTMPNYSWILAFHLISITIWMVMLTYLPKLFIYHQRRQGNDAQEEVLAFQEAKLLKIGTIAMIFSIKFGLILLYLNPLLLKSGGWLHVKLSLVFMLCIYHYFCKNFMAKLINKTSKKSETFFRIFSVLPEITTCVIIILTIVKPF